MKVYISVDIEGISGIVDREMMSPAGREYERGRMLMTQDANAAIEGAIKAGAEYIVVNDSHGPMRNLLIEELHPAAELITGPGGAKEHCMIEGADEEKFDAAIFVGYHAMARTLKAIHSHTFVGAAVAEVRINGKAHGELGVNAAVLATLGIPTVMVTGDESTVAEAHNFLGDSIETVAVKKARGYNAARCRPLADCRQDITEAAQRALEHVRDTPLYEPDRPWQLEVDFLTIHQCGRASEIRNVNRLGPVTISIEGQDSWSQYRALWSALQAAVTEPSPWLA